MNCRKWINQSSFILLCSCHAICFYWLSCTTNAFVSFSFCIVISGGLQTADILFPNTYSRKKSGKALSWFSPADLWSGLFPHTKLLHRHIIPFRTPLTCAWKPFLSHLNFMQGFCCLTFSLYFPYHCFTAVNPLQVSSYLFHFIAQAMSSHYSVSSENVFWWF